MARVPCLEKSHNTNMRFVAWLCLGASLSGCSSRQPTPHVLSMRTDAEVEASPQVLDEPAPSVVSRTGEGVADPFVEPELRAKVRVVEVRPGRYSGSYYYHQFSSCSRSFSDYTARSSLTLDLREGGVAVACRGRRIDRVNPDGRMAVEEQQGFRGSWRRDDGTIDVELDLDDGSCPQRRGYSNRVPEPWHLRCRAFVSVDAAAGPLPGPALACQFATPVYTEELGYALPGILTGDWVFLGDGPGLRVLYDNGGPLGDDRAWVRPARALIQNDEWTRPFDNAHPSATPVEHQDSLDSRSL